MSDVEIRLGRKVVGRAIPSDRLVVVDVDADPMKVANALVKLQDSGVIGPQKAVVVRDGSALWLNGWSVVVKDPNT